MENKQNYVPLMVSRWNIGGKYDILNPRSRETSNRLLVHEYG